MPQKLSWLGLSLILCSLVVMRLSAQEEGIEVPRAIRAVAKPAPAPTTPPSSGTKPDSKPAASEEEPAPAVKPSEPLPPEYLRLHMRDGALLTGKVSMPAIQVETSFGKLLVPIEKIVSFTPGLEASPDNLGELEKTIKSLGSDDYKTREQAHKDLLKMGLRVKAELERFASSDNAEIKRHIGEILKEFEEEQSNQDEDSAPTKPLIRLDTVVTTEFTIVGRVSPAEFKMHSKYGELSVKLADVRQADRPMDLKETVQKSVLVAGNDLAQRGFKNTGIRVEAGDRVTVRAEGTVVMTPWGSNAVSTPDGGQNFGWYVPNQIPGGALVAKVGDKGEVIKVGRQHTFVAKKAGVLMFAVGIQAEYAGQGYQFPGEYKVKVRVDPK